MNKVKVLVGVLCGGQSGFWVHPLLAKNLIEMVGDRRFEVQIEMTIDKVPVDFARNYAVALARERRVDYLLMIDHDQSFEISPLDVLSDGGLGKDVVIIPTMQGLDHSRFARGEQPLYPNFRTFEDESQREVDGDFFTVKSAGTGCIFIRQSIWSRKGPWFRTIQSDNELQDVRIAEDFFFTQQFCASAGFKVWCYNRLCCHWKNQEVTRLGGVLQLLTQMAEEAHKAGVPKPQEVMWNIKNGADLNQQREARRV